VHSGALTTYADIEQYYDSSNFGICLAHANFSFILVNLVEKYGAL
jgi:hypothetical protein